MEIGPSGQVRVSLSHGVLDGVFDGHEEKRIRMDQAWAVTTGLYTIEPR